MYKFIAAVSILVRQFLLPNPFEPLGATFDVTIQGVTVQLTPTIANWIAEPVLHLLAFAVAGVYYKKSEQDASVGSFLYLMFYIIHLVIIQLMTKAQFALWAVIPLIAIYIAGHIGYNYLFGSDRSYC